LHAAISQAAGGRPEESDMGSVSPAAIWPGVGHSRCCRKWSRSIQVNGTISLTLRTPVVAPISPTSARRAAACANP